MVELEEMVGSVEPSARMEATYDLNLKDVPNTDRFFLEGWETFRK
ncbi:MAG: hypothetical protein QXK37_05735 [Candidatus Woesearchaeota archaeon]